jgi:hypothetical protein
LLCVCAKAGPKISELGAWVTHIGPRSAAWNAQVLPPFSGGFFLNDRSTVYSTTDAVYMDPG